MTQLISFIFLKSNFEILAHEPRKSSNVLIISASLEITYICTSYATLLNGCHEIFNESLVFSRFNPDL